MPEPCGNDTCVDREILKMLKLHARVGQAVVTFAKDWRTYYEETGKHFMLSELEDIIIRAKEEKR